MASLRFPFMFSPPSNPPSTATSDTYSGSFSAVTAATTIAICQSPNNPFLQNAVKFLISYFSLSKSQSSPVWGSFPLSGSSVPATGTAFPSVLKGSQRLLGIGLRKKAILELKNIDVYAFGVYADHVYVKNILGGKHEMHSVSETKVKGLKDELMDSDIPMTVRLQIVYARLSIRSVRSAFEESVGSRLEKFGGSDNKELLQRFTSQFKDEMKLPPGSIIDLSRECGYVLRTTIDGKEVGSIQSKLLCRSILDLYIGDKPFDQKAKEEVEASLASLLQN